MSMIDATCFTAGIVKGLIENKDATRHFGSLMAFGPHWGFAVDLGVVVEGRLMASGRRERKVTALGHKWYKSMNMSQLKDCRAYYWNMNAKIDWHQTLIDLRK